MPRNTSEKANMVIFRLTRGQLSPLDTQRSARGCPMIVNNIQPCPKRCLLMLLTRVGARTECTTRYSYNTGRGQFPRTRIGIVHKTHMQYALLQKFASWLKNRNLRMRTHTIANFLCALAVGSWDRWLRTRQKRGNLLGVMCL